MFMARVTVEDCISKVQDRFELVAVAAQRAKEISAGNNVTIERKGEKNTVLSLREIAADKVEVDSLREGIVKSFQKDREINPDHRIMDTDEKPIDLLIAEEREELQQLAGDQGVFEDEANPDEDGFNVPEGFSFVDENVEEKDD
jgi:DNA-directed RNA polymerase subunit omega